ncbi:MAG: cysteine desulfurase [Planctomycetota bacterium]
MRISETHVIAARATEADGALEPPHVQPLDAVQVRADFPALHQDVQGHPLVYLDNAATTQKPQDVIDTLLQYYQHDNANIHRGVHTLSTRATEAYELARRKVQNFINAARSDEIIFVRGATEAINLVAQAYGRPRFRPGHEVIVSGMEHHSNLVPWQMVCEQTGATLKIAPLTDRGELDVNAYQALLGPRTRFVAVTHVSNALGTVNPVREIVQAAHDVGVPVLVDGAQAAPHMQVDVQTLGADFYALSGHKMFGPTGIGVLYGRRDRLDDMPPWQGGGDMISAVTYEKTTYAPLPFKFEAGTPNIAGAIGLGAAVDYLTKLNMDSVATYEAELLEYATRALRAIPEVRILGAAPHKAAVVSFLVDGVHPHDAGTVLDQLGIAVRAGHHCAQPVMERFGVPATCRASLALYNTTGDIDALAAGVRRVVEVFRG